MSTDQEPIVELVITEADLREMGSLGLADSIMGISTVPKLGSHDLKDPIEELMSLLPRIITTKLKRIIPSDFAIAEITLTVKVEGKFAVASVNGDLQLKLKPKS